MQRDFAIATRDELWVRGRLFESRLSHGVAIDAGSLITARDDRDDELVASVEKDIGTLRRKIAPDVDRIRLVATARRVAGVVVTESHLVLAAGELSVVTTAGHLEEDRALLVSLASNGAASEPVDYRGIPIVWRGGSASVLLHEAVGHAAEQGHSALEWPPWLSVRDEALTVDDTGAAAAPADLLAGDAPHSFRRESFRDVPMRRMSRVVASAAGAELILPSRRIEIYLVAHGTYEVLTQELTLRVAASSLVEGEASRRLPPFWIRETRQSVASALEGASGLPLRYPGVVCSLEGHEVVVGSFAPLLMTRFA